ncbi:endonuclease/exonuclease/phosphatase family protein [Nocardioides sp.]|uniref:endonuclease/exonuclease/phosphatase family protein n=1 Tax=Nocardioides sp. TaxID=35761 RepID=UPI001A1A3C65|nr:endonuclease/exonuclease/phosphatase family protein [Nocardioides sp.]MBJ7356994.1 endonuclease/exonuclease/phosphatase family protein [Nocardioides sp.]
MKRLVFWLAAAGLALPAVPLTLNRLLDSDAGPAVRMMSFTPLVTPLYVVDVLLVGGALAAGRAGPRRVLAPVLAVLVAGLGAHVWWLAPQFVGDNPAPADGAAPLVVMTTNFYAGDAAAAEVVRVAQARDVGLLVVNEITFGTLTEMEEAGIDELLPYRIGEPNGAVDGTMVFSREPLTEPTRLETTFQSWQVTVGEGADALTVLAVHPVAPVPPAGASTWRAEHETLLAAAQQSEATLVLGDLNASPDHAVLRAWRDAGYRDSLELVNAGWSPTWPSNGITPVPGFHPPALIQIDHVLVTSALAVTESFTVDVPGSDHRAVVATVARR